MAGLIEWDKLHQSLRAIVKTLHPVSNLLGTAEKSSAAAEDELLKQILDELKAIRKAVEN